MNLARKWLEAKNAETTALAERREIEDEMIALYEVSNQSEGTKIHKEGNYKIKILTRIYRKVDSEKVQDLAAEHGLSEHLGELFRWKPEINSAAWNAATDTITRPLLGAITATPARPSFSIIITE